MSYNCPACGSPITDDARFCSHCGVKLPDNVQRIEIKTENKTQYRYEDAAKLEEIRLRYEREEKMENLRRQEQKEEAEKHAKATKKLCIICWAVGIILFSLAFSGWLEPGAALGLAGLALCAIVGGLINGYRALFHK